MILDLISKRNLLNDKLRILKHDMARYFKCNDAFVNFSEPEYIDGGYKVKTELHLINSETPTLRKLETTTYLFEFESDPSNMDKICYEGNYDDPLKFFEKIRMEIENQD